MEVLRIHNEFVIAVFPIVCAVANIGEENMSKVDGGEIEIDPLTAYDPGGQFYQVLNAKFLNTVCTVNNAQYDASRKCYVHIVALP